MAVSETAPAAENNLAGQNAEEQTGPAALKKKLHGREFYKSIGSPKYIVAPMVDRSEFAWRMLTRSFMSPEDSKSLLAYSPMFHARLYRENPGFRSQHFHPTRAAAGVKGDESLFLDGNPAFDRPLIVQFCANDPDDFLESARYVAPYCDAVDLNLGCPQGIARRGHYGAFLQEDWNLIYKLINRLHTELSVPITAKFRIQESKEKTLEYAKMILSAGASIITLHGRTREQKGHNTGLADWTYIRYLRDNLPPETVIFANGNNLNHGDLQRCLEATGADGVMSAEGNLTDPSIFSKPPPVGSEDREYWRGRDGKGGYRIDAVFRRYLDVIYKYVLEQPVPERKPLYIPSDPEEPEPETANSVAEPEDIEEGPPKKKQKRERVKQSGPPSPSLKHMQAHLFQLLRPMVSTYTNVRDALARSSSRDMATFEHALSLVEKVIKDGLKEYEQFPERFETPADADLSGTKGAIAEYGRPFWVCQPHIRPSPEEAVELGALSAKKGGKEKKAENIESQEKTNTATVSGLATPVNAVDTPTTVATDALVNG